MKNTKRLAIVILILALLTSCALLVLSACDDSCKVTLDYDSTQGSVTLSAAQSGGNKYAKGESVTVTVTASNGYKVSSFSVTGYPDAALTNGQYTFVIESNTTVKVTFEQLTGNYYTVTVQADEGATVTLSPQPVNGNQYQEGTLVTVTLQLQDGYSVGTCYVDNAIVRFTNNQYSFTVLHDTLVEVSAYKAIPSSVLNSLRGNIMFAGSAYSVSQSISTGKIKTTLEYEFFSMYDADKQLVRQSESSENSNFVEFGCDEQGYVAWPTHGYDGKFKWERMTDENGNYLPFTSYFNPFEYLTATDFQYESENTISFELDGMQYTYEFDSIWSLNSTTAQNVIKSISGYTYSIDVFKIGVVDGEATTIFFQTTESRTGVRSTYTMGEYAITHDIDAFDDDILLDEYPEQTELEQALANAAEVTKYKVKHSYTNGTHTGYDIYRDGDVVWITGDDYSYGYIIRPDEMVWEFSFDNGKMVLGKAVAYDMLSVVATFDLGGASPSMFKHVGDGRYVLRDSDLNGYYGEDLVTNTSMSFATGADEQTEFYFYATNIAITLDNNGVLSKVEVYYYAYDADYNIVENTIVLEFSEFGMATIPSDVEIDEDVVNGIIPVDYLGVWLYDGEPHMRVDIALDTVTIDGVVSTSVTKTGEKTYEVIVDGDQHILIINDDGNLVLDGKQLRFRECDWEDMFGEYSGLQQDEYQGLVIEDRLTLTITAEGVTFTIISSVEGLEYYTLTKIIGKADLFYTEAYDNPMLYFTYEDDGNEFSALVSFLAKGVVNFYVSDGTYYYYDINAYVGDYNFKDWSIFIGEYADGENTLKIEADKITLYYNGETIEFGAEDITYYAVEYIMPIFIMTHGSTTYEFHQYGGTNSKLQLFLNDEDGSVATFVKKGYTMSSWMEYVGKYAGDYTNEDDDITVSYRVEITADGVKMWIDGVEQKVTVDDFDIYLFSDGTNNYKLYSFSLTCEGDTTVHYSLRQGNVNVTDVWVLTCAEDNDLFVVLELFTDDGQGDAQN